MKQHNDMYQRQAMYPQMIFPHGGPMMPNSQMPPGAANMHPQYEYHFQQFPQSPVSGVPGGEYPVHIDGNQQMQGYHGGGGGGGGGGKNNNKMYGNRKVDDSRPTDEGDFFSENSNQNGGGAGDDYNPHFRAAANSRPPEGIVCLHRYYLSLFS